MKINLEDFMNSNKDEFDTYEPSEALWSRVENQLQKPRKRGIIASITTRKLMSAAAAIVIIAAAAFFYKNSTVKPDVSVAAVNALVNKIPERVDSVSQIAATPGPDTQNSEPSPILSPITKETPELASNETLKSITDQEMVHYTKLVELKQAQISILKKDEPLLYKQFASDFDKIDEEFKTLKIQQNSHPDNEQLLEAMIQNLRLQSALLNRQLEIIKTINNNKKKNYENTYNSTI